MFRIITALSIASVAYGYDNGAAIAAMPPRGWSTWCTDDLCGLLDFCYEEEIREIADALVAPPLSQLNYSLILLGKSKPLEVNCAQRCGPVAFKSNPGIMSPHLAQTQTLT